MGAWGTYPKDSDGALDLKSEIDSVINKELEVITKELSDFEHYDYAGLIMLLLQEGHFIKYKFVAQAVAYMKKELENTINGNQSGWRDQKKTIKDITYLITEFEKILKEEEKSYSKSKKPKWEKRLQESELLVPPNWLLRKNEINKKSWSGLFDNIK